MKIGIVGAGIAGSYLAYRLSKKHDVTVFDMKSEIGNKACSGLVSERLWDFVPKNNRLVKNRIKNIIIHFKNKEVILDLHPRMIVLERYKLDRYVMSLSKAKLKMNTSVKNIEFRGKPSITTNRGKFEFDYVIGCDGAKSMIRQQLGGKDPKFNLGVLAYEKRRSKCNCIDVWPLPHGFAWKIPRGTDIEYGVFERPDRAYKEFKRFCKKPRVIYSALIPHGFVNVAKKNATLCGDAAGLAKPWSGGGIIWTLKSADMLVKDFPDFKKYDNNLRDFFEPRIFFSEIVSKIGVSIGNNLPSIVPKEINFDSDWIF